MWQTDTSIRLAAPLLLLEGLRPIFEEEDENEDEEES